MEGFFIVPSLTSSRVFSEDSSIGDLQDTVASSADSLILLLQHLLARHGLDVILPTHLFRVTQYLLELLMPGLRNQAVGNKKLLNKHCRLDFSMGFV